jgi:hypothetical protein
MRMYTHLNITRSSALSLAAAFVFALATLVFGTTQTMTGGSVAPAFRGEWVPAKAGCTSSLKLVVEPNVVTFVKGADRAEYRKLDQCFSCAGHDVENVTLLTTDAQGDSPFTIYLDGSKKKPSIEVYFDNDKKLAARFPFGKASLKKCK